MGHGLETSAHCSRHGLLSPVLDTPVQGTLSFWSWIPPAAPCQGHLAPGTPLSCWFLCPANPSSCHKSPKTLRSQNQVTKATYLHEAPPSQTSLREAEAPRLSCGPPAAPTSRSANATGESTLRFWEGSFLHQHRAACMPNPGTHTHA